ncbi:MAG: methionine--tRNA ligase subunit beta [Candidatus Spechtbacterales bacterium]|nr:methionine--tRNA ligase subunit beta [Candidatus Spechtbacterales bacterium]
MISFDDFKKLDMRAGTIMEAEHIEDSDKLMKLLVNLGDEVGERQIIAGIGKNHVPENVEGRQIIVLVNLEPKKLMGLESEGMLLAAGPEEGPVLLMPENEVPPGTKIS